MLETLAVSTLLLGSAIAFAQPAAARDRDDYRNNNNRDRDRYASNYARRDNRERGEWQEHERFENRRVPYASSYRSGYRDQRFGFSDPRYGYYDRFGNWCWY
jgi:hypothetical protein